MRTTRVRQYVGLFKRVSNIKIGAVQKATKNQHINRAWKVSLKNTVGIIINDLVCTEKLLNLIDLFLLMSPVLAAKKLIKKELSFIIIQRSSSSFTQISTASLSSRWSFCFKFHCLFHLPQHYVVNQPSLHDGAKWLNEISMKNSNRNNNNRLHMLSQLNSSQIQLKSLFLILYKSQTHLENDKIYSDSLLFLHEILISSLAFAVVYLYSKLFIVSVVLFTRQRSDALVSIKFNSLKMAKVVAFILVACISIQVSLLIRIMFCPWKHFLTVKYLIRIRKFCNLVFCVWVNYALTC